MQISQILEEKSQAGPRAKAGKAAAGFGNALQEVIRQLGIGSAAHGTGGDALDPLSAESDGSAGLSEIRMPGAARRGRSEGDDGSSAGKSNDGNDTMARCGLAAMMASLAAASSLSVPAANRPITGTHTDAGQISSASQASDSASGPETVFLRAGTGKNSVLPGASPMAAGVSQPPQTADALSRTETGTDGKDSQTVSGLPDASPVPADTPGRFAFLQAVVARNGFPVASSVPAGMAAASSPVSADGGKTAAAGSSTVSAWMQASPSLQIRHFSQPSPLSQVSQVSPTSPTVQILQASQLPQTPRAAVLPETDSQHAAARTEGSRPVSRFGGTPDSSGQPSSARTGVTLPDGGSIRRVQPRENGQPTDGRTDGQSSATGGTVISMFRDHGQSEDRTAAADGSFHTESVARQLAGALNASADGGRSELRLHLSPADLGGINIRLVSQDGQVTLRITADNPHTGQLLASSLDDLNHAMGQNGVHMDRTEVFYSSADSSGGYPSNSGGQPDPGGQTGGGHSFAGGNGSSGEGRQAPEVYGAVPIRQTEEPVRTASPGTISIFA